jgi:hypothetical protein
VAPILKTPEYVEYGNPVLLRRAYQDQPIQGSAPVDISLVPFCCFAPQRSKIRNATAFILFNYS